MGRGGTWEEVVRLLDQDEVWLRGVPLTELSEDHRANLVPFLRGNAKRLQRLAWALEVYGRPDVEDASDDVWMAKLDPQEWLATTPLMRRLLEFERVRPVWRRRLTAARNRAYELATGYVKVRER